MIKAKCLQNINIKDNHIYNKDLFMKEKLNYEFLNL